MRLTPQPMSPPISGGVDVALKGEGGADGDPAPWVQVGHPYGSGAVGRCGDARELLDGGWVHPEVGAVYDDHVIRLHGALSWAFLGSFGLFWALLGFFGLFCDVKLMCLIFF